jgi:hypothetical protein
MIGEVLAWSCAGTLVAFMAWALAATALERFRRRGARRGGERA